MQEFLTASATILLYRSRSLITNVISCMLRLSLANDVAAILSLVSLSVYSPHYSFAVFKRYKAAAPAAAYPVRFLCSFALLSPICPAAYPRSIVCQSTSKTVSSHINTQSLHAAPNRHSIITYYYY
jgi:hypothetical protein